uniref:Glucose-6-phosphate isomerase n=1 Tax=Heterosigma akashiwo TaxID=2829 RepID=A0A7S3XRD9_HETAK
MGSASTKLSPEEVSAMSNVKIWETAAWAALKNHKETVTDQLHLRDLLQDTARSQAMMVEHNGITLDFSRQIATTQTLDLLCDLANAAMFEQKRTAMFSGEHINNTEDRAVGHYALRAPRSAGYVIDGVNASEEVNDVLDKMFAFAEKVRSGEWTGATGKPLTTVIAIGIGGSYLGPDFLFEALKTDGAASAAAAGRRLKFLANVDPIDFARCTAGEDPETCLVLIVSKTFTTAETMLNARTMKKWLVDGIPSADAATVAAKHIAAVSTAAEEVAAFGIDPANMFGFWNWVGGRFSVSSAVGVCPLALHYGPAVMREFLRGMHEMDEHYRTAPLRENLPVLLGLWSVWNSTFQGFPSRALLPYCQALMRLPAHIQQVTMESNGKRVTVNGDVVPFETGEVDFGEPGTNGQHSFYQLMHQGRVVPADFIAFCESQQPVNMEGEAVSNHDELMANFFAQPDALACGKTLAELEAEGVPEAMRPHKEFPGNRPSSSLLLPRADAYYVGQLLAIYEHRTAVQGAIWGVNSFDQWGVQLGKVLGLRVRAQLQQSRANAAAPLAGFNPSTAALLGKYLASSSA